MKTLSQALRALSGSGLWFGDAADAAEELERRVEDGIAAFIKSNNILVDRVAALEECWPKTRLENLEAIVKELNNQILVLENRPQKQPAASEMDLGDPFNRGLCNGDPAKPQTAPPKFSHVLGEEELDMAAVASPKEARRWEAVQEIHMRDGRFHRFGWDVPTLIEETPAVQAALELAERFKGGMEERQHEGSDQRWYACYRRDGCAFSRHGIALIAPEKGEWGK
jgi:hypothetical protein